VVRQAHFIAVVGAFLSAFLVVGCAGSGGTGNIDGHGGERDAGATSEETTASTEDQSAAKATQEPASLDVEVVPSGGAYSPAGFGDGSLWATDIATCNDTGSPSSSASSSVSSVDGSLSVSLVACAMPDKMLLKRLDPRTGEEVATIPLKHFFTEILEVTYGAGSVWVSSGYYPGAAKVVLRIDPQTNRVVETIPVDTPSGLDFGHGSVWVTSAGHGTLSRIDPESGKVVAKIEVGKGAVDIATDEGSGAVWVADWLKNGKLTRVDPETNRVVAQIPIRPGAQEGGASSVAVGEGAVWAQSVDGRLLKVDPATNEVVASVPLGDYSSYLAIYGDAVWATVQGFASERRLLKVDPRTARVIADEDVGPVSKTDFGQLVAGGGRVWFVSAAGKMGKGELAWVEP
jgi:DNA-binding beta-propeller fold protein YncE